MPLPILYSVKRIERQLNTGEQPVLVTCSDINTYVCKYMRSSAAAYKLVCELIGAEMANALTKTLIMNNLKYSIIYAIIRPEIAERISVGLIFVDGEKVDIRYSQQKLDALRGLFPQKEYEFVSKVVRSMHTSGKFNNVNDINYLSRYSNNLIAVSPLQSIDIEPTEQSKNRLFQNYIYA